MRTTISFLFLLVLCFTTSGAETIDAFDAVRLLPKEKAARLAHIEGRDGNPTPHRWYLIVHDETEPTGVREFAVAGKEVVASRTISQFSETVKPEDVLDAQALKIDSDRVAQLAQEYARANNVTIGTLNYELKKEEANAAPRWKVTCVDSAGNKVAALMVTASTGSVVSHDGFASEPRAPSGKKKRLSTYAENQVARHRAASRPRPTAQRRQEEPPPPIDRVGSSLRRFFTGRP